MIPDPIKLTVKSLPKINQDIIDKLNGNITVHEVGAVIKSPHKEKPRPNGS